MVTEYNWHKQVFSKVLKNIAKHAKQYIGGYSLDGWYDWFESTYPEAFRKYQDVAKSLNAIWGKGDTKSMDEFKKLSKDYEDVYKWAIGKYVEHLKDLAEEETLKGRQEVLV